MYFNPLIISSLLHASHMNPVFDLLHRFIVSGRFGDIMSHSLASTTYVSQLV